MKQQTVENFFVVEEFWKCRIADSVQLILLYLLEYKNARVTKFGKLHQSRKSDSTFLVSKESQLHIL